MLGNLQIYLGQDALNAYAKKLKSMPLLLWSARAGLLTLFALICSCVYLRRVNRRARPQRYAVDDAVDVACVQNYVDQRTRRFCISHLPLLHFTLGVTDPQITY